VDATELAGISGVLLLGARWTLVGTAAVLSLASVRGLTGREAAGSAR
jgi:hypothetical protein